MFSQEVLDVFSVALQIKIVLTSEPIEVEIELGPPSKFDKKNKASLKKVYDNAISANYYSIKNDYICCQLGAIRN